ncbi:MAG TPA: PQQ-binding-like beta-propeller repeat protein, partial [Actinomycetota bacterium]|nr:PQQ-binding-like beta-propeller repeat protein [Actinomycetota bacterium]
MTPLRRSRALAVFLILAAAGTLLVQTSGAIRAEAVQNADWDTFGGDAYRTGYNPNETVIGTGNVGNLHLLWSFDLGAVTISQPAYAAGVNVGGTAKDLVLAGSEHGMLFALDATNGQVVWSRYLGDQQTGCGDMPDGRFGVSGTPAIDRSANRVYEAGGDGAVYALDLSTGATIPGWPIAVTPDPTHEHVYGALTLYLNRLYATVASYCDFTPYHGKVVGIDTSMPARTAVWYPVGNGGVSGGGIWGPGGVSLDPGNGHVFAATGNALTFPENYRYAETVDELGPRLRVLGSNKPSLTGGDVDFGATPLLYQAPGCPPQAVAKNKSGVLLLYDRGQLNAGYVQRLQIASVGDWEFNGIPAYDPATNMVYIGNSSDAGIYTHGMVTLAVQ